MAEYQHLAPVENIQRYTVREYDMVVYDFLERNKDYICEAFKLPRYNPTDMKNAYIKWLKRNRLPRQTSDGGTPCKLTEFFMGDTLL